MRFLMDVFIDIYQLTIAHFTKIVIAIFYPPETEFVEC